MALNFALKTAIIAAGTSQIEVAQKTHIHESRLSKIIRGYLSASDDEKRRIARVLRKSVDELFGVAA